MTYKEIAALGKQKNSLLCVGLDTDLSRIPAHIKKEKDPIFEFNRRIIDATVDLCIGYKPNLAFYEAHGAKGWESLQRTMEYIPESVFTIADAKRGDIGNTAGMYAKAFFEELNFDAVTVAPYMGRDSVDPFLSYKNKWVILLARTSNASSADFQELNVAQGQTLYEKVIRTSTSWSGMEQLMYVVGATQPESLKKIRSIVPDHFILVPGIGAQGGNLEEVFKYGANTNGGLLINSSRQILYASGSKDFQEASAKEAKMLNQQMMRLMDRYC